MRCNQCGKFVSQEEGDPEVSDEGYADGSVTATVRIVQCCQECSSELKEATLELEGNIDFCSGDGHEVSVQVEAENDCKTQGKGRYTQTFYGAKAVFNLECSCGRKDSIELVDHVAASGMDECQ